MTRIGLYLICLSTALLPLAGCAAPARLGHLISIDQAAEETEVPSIEDAARNSGLSEEDARELARILETTDERYRPMMTQMFLATLSKQREESSDMNTAPATTGWPQGNRRRRPSDLEGGRRTQSTKSDGALAKAIDQGKQAAESVPTPAGPEATSSRRTAQAPATASLSDGDETTKPLNKDEAVVVASGAQTVEESPGDAAAEEATPPATITAANKTASLDESPPTPAPAEKMPTQPELEQINWQQSLQRTIQGIEDRLANERMSETERMRVQAHLGLLNIIAEDPEKATNAFQDLDEEELEFWRQTTMALDALLAPNELPRRSHRVELAVNHLRTGVKALATLGPLRVRNLAFCTKVSGFGDFREFESYTFTPGQQVLLYVEIEDFAVEQVESVTTTRSTSAFSTRRASHEVAGELTYKTELHARYEILDEDQRRVATKVLPVDRESCRNHRQDYYIPYLIYLPDNLEPGHYKLELVVEDKKGVGKVGFAAVDFQVERQ
jgi:hypothetical protein